MNQEDSEQNEVDGMKKGADSTDFTDLNLYSIKRALALFVLVSGYVCYIKLYTQLSSPR